MEPNLKVLLILLQTITGALSIVCKDESTSCEEVKDDCKDSWVQDICQKTCGFCCKDASKSCIKLKSKCETDERVRKDCRCTCRHVEAPELANIFTGPSSGVVKLKIDADGNVERDQNDHEKNISCYRCQNKNKKFPHYDADCGKDGYTGEAIRDGFGSCITIIERGKLNIETVQRNGHDTVISKQECSKDMSSKSLSCTCGTDNCNSETFSYDNIVNTGNFITVDEIVDEIMLDLFGTSSK